MKHFRVLWKHPGENEDEEMDRRTDMVDAVRVDGCC